MVCVLIRKLENQSRAAGSTKEGHLFFMMARSWYTLKQCLKEKIGVFAVDAFALTLKLAPESLDRSIRRAKLSLISINQLKSYRIATISRGYQTIHANEKKTLTLRLN